MSSCIGCNQAITQQKANDEYIISKAKERAFQENKSIALYRNEQGELCIADGPNYPICQHITPLMQRS